MATCYVRGRANPLFSRCSGCNGFDGLDRRVLSRAHDRRDDDHRRRRAGASPIDAPVTREAAPAAEVAEADGPAPAPPGQLVCRTKSVVDGTTEVFLEWNGSSAKGTLRREAPSGMVYVQRVQAERAASLIIVDEPSNEDLMSHAAVIGKQDGKTLMRIGGAGQPWTPCE